MDSFNGPDWKTFLTPSSIFVIVFIILYDGGSNNKMMIDFFCRYVCQCYSSLHLMINFINIHYQ